MSDPETSAVQQYLEQLSPRGAPPELRQRVLSSLQNQAPAAPVAPKASRLDSGLNIAVAVSVLAAAIFWLGSGHFQRQRLAELLGPSPAQQRVDRAMETMQLATDTTRLQPWRDHLRFALETSHGRRSQSVPPHAILSSAFIATRETIRHEKKVQTRRQSRPLPAGCLLDHCSGDWLGQLYPA